MLLHFLTETHILPLLLPLWKKSIPWVKSRIQNYFWCCLLKMLLFHFYLDEDVLGVGLQVEVLQPCRNYDPLVVVALELRIGERPHLCGGTAAAQ